MKKPALTAALLSALLLTAIAGTLFINLASCAYPEVSILSPENGQICHSSWVTVTFNATITRYTFYFPVSGQTFFATCFVDGWNFGETYLENSGQHSIITKEIPDGTHKLIVRVRAIYNMADGTERVLEGSSEEIVITVEASAPIISIIDLDGKTFNITDIPLNFNTSEPVTSMSYSLDQKDKVAIAGNTTISGLSDGTHTLTVYAKDAFGNTGASKEVSFEIITQDEQPPGTPPEEEPEEPAPLPATWIAITIVALVAAVSFGLLAYSVKKRIRRQS